jgi:hypothetical protein
MYPIHRASEALDPVELESTGMRTFASMSSS